MSLRLRELRDDHDVKQATIAEALNITQSAYSRYENEEMPVPKEILIGAAMFYNSTIDFIVGLSDNKYNE